MSAQSRERFPILIVGTGAMACLFGARLAALGHPITFVGSWSTGVTALRRGLRLVELGGEEQVFTVRAFTDPNQAGSFAFALVLVKAWQVAQAVERLRVTLREEGVALTLMNGVGPQEELQQALGTERVAVGVTTAGATLLEPGRVLAAGPGEIWVGRHPRIEPLLQALEQAGFPVHRVEEVWGVLWGKLLINVAINPFGALLGVPNGALREDPAALLFMRRAVEEVLQVVQSLGIRLPFADPWAQVLRVLERAAANRNSMLQDLERGAPTEIDALCGAVVRYAQRLGLSAPLNQALWEMVRERVQARQASGRSDSARGTPGSGAAKTTL